jgi:hypothetical protein
VGQVGAGPSNAVFHRAWTMKQGLSRSVCAVAPDAGDAIAAKAANAAIVATAALRR